MSRTYESVPPVHALKATTLEIRSGEYVAIMGRSGSGKSTLLNILGLLDTPTAGEYFLGGHPTTHLSEPERCGARAHRIGFVFQSFELVSYRTALENVELGLLYQRTDRKLRQRRSIEALERVDLGHKLGSRPSQLSGGERQRVAIARALVSSPSLVLCDEPTGNLDSTTSQNLLLLLDELRSDGMTIVVITHDPEVGAAADRLVTVRDGALSEAGTSASLAVGGDSS